MKSGGDVQRTLYENELYSLLGYHYTFQVKQSWNYWEKQGDLPRGYTVFYLEEYIVGSCWLAVIMVVLR